MNNIKSLYDLYGEVERISRSLPNVNTFTESFDNLNREDTEYSAVVFQFRDGTQPSEGFVTYRFYLGYVDRVNEVNGSPSSNETLIQSVAEQSLRTIINKVNEEVEFKYGSLTPFEQRFTALTAGCYIDCSVTLAVSDCNYESGSVLRDLNIYVDKNMTEEFVPGPGVDGFKKVNLEVNIPLDKCVQVVEQDFTDDEKRIARENINAIEDEAGVIDTEHIATGAVTEIKLDSGIQSKLTKADKSVVWVKLTKDVFNFTEQTKTFDVNVGDIKIRYSYPPIISMSYQDGYYTFDLYPVVYASNSDFFYYRGFTCYFSTVDSIRWRYFDLELYVSPSGEGQLIITESHPDVGRLKLSNSDTDFVSTFDSLTAGNNEVFYLDVTNSLNIIGNVSPFYIGLSSVSVTDSKGVTVVLQRVNSLNNKANYECTTAEGAKFTYSEGDDMLWMYKTE